MINLFTKRKRIALTLLVVWTGNICAPAISYALTSGPAQPEVQGFQVASVSDMVDLSSGGLKYNIPLLDIDGYPVNLSYQSGSGIDDEASWVGLGWSCTPGAITRQVRGLPDDFSGDMVETDHYVKPKITIGGRLTAKTEAFGIARLQGTFTFGVFNDNYTGLGAELGVNAGVSFSTSNDGLLTAGLGIGVLSNTQSGVDADISPYVCMAIKENTDNNATINAGLSGSFGYNTRSGLKALTLGASFGAGNNVKNDNGDIIKAGEASYSVAGSSISYNTEPISPSVQVPYTSSYGSYSFDVGLAGEGIFGSIGGTGYKNVRQVQTIANAKPAFGFLYAERGKDNPDAIMDFIRENDNPVIPTLPDLAIPIHTPDIWSYTSQSGGGQFRLYRGGSGAFFDNQTVDGSTTSTLGGDLGVGAWVHGGITLYNQTAKTATHKWTSNNNYLAYGDFQKPNYSNPSAEHVYFRQVGEKNVEDQDMDSQLHGTQALAVSTSGITANSAFRNASGLNSSVPIDSAIAKTSRRPNRTVISYLTAAEAQQAGLYKSIPEYSFKDSSSIATLTANQIYTPLPRVDATGNDTTYIHKPHHISEITVTDDGGKRMVYGIPVYNIYQDEYSFAIDRTSRDTNNLACTPTGISNPKGDPYGVDNYYHKEHKPSYATSYLLSAILSSDYVDKTGNGITDDDLGTAIKFNYSKLAHYYKWRTPYNKATPNRGLLADPDDDKGSIVYGKKEVWYVQSIESKTKIAYFITGDRRDALGVSSWQNGGSDPSNTQKYLKEIRLYSKADMTRPIKVVKFQYTYELCTGIPNSLDYGSGNHLLGGKLTLSKVWFEYGNSDKGKYHPYVFQYNKTNLKYNGANTPKYAYNSTDRWGIYKPATENANHLANEQYPYTNQDTSYTNQNSALWQLSQIALPTGGVINVSYESGDYAYVQNQKAMVMSKIVSLIIDTTSSMRDTTRLLNAIKGIRVNIGTANLPPAGVDQTTWFKNNFLNGSNYLYTKMCDSMGTNNYRSPDPRLSYDFVPTYCLIQSVHINSAGMANIMLTPITAGGVTANPMIISAWQRMKNEYPRYAYPGFENRVQTNNNSVLAAVSAVINAAKNLTELEKSFYQKANSRGYCSKVLLGNSFVKLAINTGAKIGGPVRVKKIQISDTWNATGGPNTASSYGQSYTYTTTENGKTISSGVATYEPAIGNDENALKQPVPYIENIKGAINNYFDLEMPFCESLYPAPTVTYSKVTVADLDKTGTSPPQTGTIVNEFYTSKDFPVKVTALPVVPYEPRPNAQYSLTQTNSDDELCMSQGYSIELNDMNGKTKATTVYDQSGAVISSTAYYYNATNNGNGMSLNNNVQVVNPSTLQVSSQVLGRDVDFFTDFREQQTSNTGTAVNVGFDIFPIPPFLPFFGLPHFPIHENNDRKLFRSACAVKVIQNYGILSKVVKTENGSSITTDNLAYDALTGEAVVTRTKNEFNRPIYSTNIPAYWIYNGMGAAYQNLGVSFSQFTTNANGEINPIYASYLHGGDEIVDTQSGIHYWVIYNQAASGSGNTKKLIDINGNINASYNPPALVKIVRSGFRNMLTAGATTLVSLNSPITAANYLQLNTSGNLTAMKVINASATTYDESWAGANNQCVDNKIDPTLNLIENTTRDFSLSATMPLYGGMTITDFNNPSVDTVIYSAYWGGNTSTNMGRRKVIGFWPHEAITNPSDTSYSGYDVVVNFPETKVYYFAFAFNPISQYVYDCQDGDDGESYQLDGDFLDVQGKLINAGKHIIHVTFKLKDPNVPLANRCSGLEIYNNTFNDLIHADSVGTGLNILFSTKNYVGNNNVLNFFDTMLTDSDQVDGHQSYHYTRPDGNPPFYNFNYCVAPQPLILNPYIAGYLGNWRPYQTKVFQQSRNYIFSSNRTLASVDVKNAGYINNFYPYWYSNAGTWTVNPNGTRWVTANTVTLYDKYGQQLENKDALGRFSAANFDFNGELPSAVASNAMNREIYAASLEDSYFTFGDSSNSDTCNIREFIQPSTKRTIKQLAVNTVAHSGNYSALLPSDGVTLSTIIDTVHQKTVPYLALDSKKQYITQTTTGLYPNGFEPYPGKQYLFDAWVSDAYPNTQSININLSINGTNVPLKCKAVVEGWKLVEGIIDLSTLGSATALNISIVPVTGTVYIDDIRMHPFDAQMKSYAYDDKTMRLMAELDENGFATFYEYDDEGLLIRVKKETEKGIMTLKESRSTYRRNLNP
ncbi:hypothetical protein SAMN05216490_0137 [Mucilaginibacter mallensis]|uniref:RHS repeat-associated core domain-containing protein n=1 Tax=Mucilaginibacter mallensis TaxID=652787 RepID=A0A1H1MQF4_MUCMA|nr:hypothetical protein [Mucilaginibacter mallensis]SDR88957.1 hypothetical protein SAMN05216490_0137 [Mucilaginibacter mallensis]